MNATTPWTCSGAPTETSISSRTATASSVANADAGIYRWEYVKGTRAPEPVLTTDKTDGALPLTVHFSSAGSSDADPGDSITFDWDFGDGSAHSMDPDPVHVYTTRGRRTVVLTVTDSSGLSATASVVITAGNTSPTVSVDTPVEGGTFAFGDDIPFHVDVSDPEDGTINCNDVHVTFVLGHDTHGHVEDGTVGCDGVLQTDPDDVAHGGNVFGIVSADLHRSRRRGRQRSDAERQPARRRSARSTRRSSS